MKSLRIVLPGEQEVTPAMRDYAKTNLLPIEKSLKDAVIHSIHIVVKVRGNGKQKVELTVNSSEGLFRREDTGEDYYDVLPGLVKGITRAVKVKRKKERETYMRASNGIHQQLNMFDENLEDEEQHSVNVKRVDTHPMTLDEAVDALEAVGHPFYLYLDVDSEQPTVVYQKVDGGYECIELSLF